MQVSPFCLGIVDDPAVVPAAFDAGINFFFITADMHWPEYAPLCRGIEMLLSRGGDIRDRIVVAGVSYVTQPEFCKVPFMELLENVRGLERLDVLIAGGAYGHELGRRMPIYQAHREHAHCGARAIGASFHDRKAAVAPLCEGTLDLCLARYNSGHTGARDDLFPHVANRRALLFNFCNTRGFVSSSRCDELGIDPELWRPTRSDHYRFVLSQPEVDGVLCSLTKVEYLTALLEALDEGPLEQEEQDHLVLLSKLHAGTSTLVP